MRTISQINEFRALLARIESIRTKQQWNYLHYDVWAAMLDRRLNREDYKILNEMLYASQVLRGGFNEKA